MNGRTEEFMNGRNNDKDIISSRKTTKESTKKNIRGTISTADLVDEYKLYHMINYRIGDDDEKEKLIDRAQNNKIPVTIFKELVKEPELLGCHPNREELLQKITKKEYTEEDLKTLRLLAQMCREYTSKAQHGRYMIRGRNYDAQCPESRHEWISIPQKTDKRTDRKTNILLRLTSEELKTIDLKEIKKRLRKENSEDVWYSIVKKFEK